MTPPPPGRFASTRWTRVIAARGRDEDGLRALSELCADYYEPVHAFISQTVNGAANARDLTHDFFARLLERPSLDSASPQRGRFRSYLLGAVKHFLRDEWRKGQAGKRGGGQPDEALEEYEDILPADDRDGHEAAAMFDREWAIALVNRVLDDLENEYDEEGKGDVYSSLKPWLTGNIETSQAAAAAELAVSEGAVKVAIHRLRKRFRELVALELEETLENPDEAAAERDYLIRALSSPPV